MSYEEEKRLKKLERWELAANLAMRYGSLKIDTPFHKIQELWKDDYPPGMSRIKKSISNSNIKWYINNLYETQDPIWNGSFIAGITKAGKVKWSHAQFATFEWWGAPILAEALEECPYHGTVTNGRTQKIGKHAYKWKNVPALYLKSDPTSISYLAGLLATGRKWEHKGKIYALYKENVMEELNGYGIPVEAKTRYLSKPLASPFWPALFTVYMPPSCTPYWLGIKPKKLAYKCEKISAILWQTYSEEDPSPNRLPYLQSRRTIFYKYKNEEHGAIQNLQRLRVENNLISLDNKIRDCIGVWINKKEENDGISTN